MARSKAFVQAADHDVDANRVEIMRLLLRYAHTGDVNPPAYLDGLNGKAGVGCCGKRVCCLAYLAHPVMMLNCLSDSIIHQV